MPRPITAIIHLDALQHNYAVAQRQSPSAKVWAVVKANAYGHGLENALRAFAHADGLALIEVDGAIKLRTLGWTKPLFLLEGFFHVPDIALVVRHNIDVAVHCFEQIALLEQAQRNSVLEGKRIKIHLKVNGGMNRLGFKPADVVRAYQRLVAIPAVHVVDLMMHFANADDAANPQLPMAAQLHRFEQVEASLEGVKLERSLSNSAANLLAESIVNNWVRAGIMLYGGSPGQRTAEEFGLLPGMTLQSELIAIQEIEAGESVGYGSRFVASKTMRIGVVACGYADGYPRHAIDGTPMLVNGVRTRMVGRVSMDMVTVDVTDIPDAKVGSVVTLWGKGLPVDEVAHACGTIGYELMCAIASRVQIIVEQ